MNPELTPETEFYQATPERKDWNNPTHAQMVVSLNKAHDVNRRMTKELGDLRKQFESAKKKLFWVNLQRLALAGILGGAAAEGIKVAVISLLGLLKHAG